MLGLQGKSLFSGSYSSRPTYINHKKLIDLEEIQCMYILTKLRQNTNTVYFISISNYEAYVNFNIPSAVIEKF